MAATVETAVKKNIRSILDARGAYHHSPATGGYGRNGAPDISACYCGYAIGIEAKSIHSAYGRRGPTLLQQEHLKALFNAGGIGLVINETNYNLLEEVLNELEHGQLDRARNRALGEYRDIVARNTARVPGGVQPPAPVLRRRR